MKKLAVLLSLILLSIARNVAAIPVIDQQQPIVNENAGGLVIGGQSQQKLAQVITVGISGFLTEIRVPVACDSGSDLVVEIHGVTAGAPNGSVLATQTVPASMLSNVPFAFQKLTLATPVFFLSQNQFAIVLMSVGACGIFQGPVGDSYIGGDRFFDALPNPPGWIHNCGEFVGASCDLPFQTLVEPVTPVVVTKAFGATSIPLTGTTLLTFTLKNESAIASHSGVAFIDVLPAGLVVATPNALTGGCGGGSITAPPGSGAVSLSGATLSADASCAFSVNVTGTTPGVKNNTVQVSSVEGGTGNTSTASITIVAPPTIAKHFSAPSMPLNGSTVLSFTIGNPNAGTSLSNVAFADNLPAGLLVAAPNGLSNTCGGAATATAGSGSLSLTNGTVAAGASCAVSINVTGIAAGDQINTTGPVSSANGGIGTTATATTTVVAPPTIGTSFAPSRIVRGTSTTLTFTLTNPAVNTVALTGVGFTDLLPAGLGISAASTGTCGGTLTTIGPNSIVLTGATIAVNGECQFSVTVYGNSTGDFLNTTSNVASINGGAGAAASATLSVVAPPLIPTLSNWALGALATLLLFVALGCMRKRQLGERPWPISSG